MSVAEQFKSAKIADLAIQPSAAYLLAAPSVPDEARERRSRMRKPTRRATGIAESTLFITPIGRSSFAFEESYSQADLHFRIATA
jgi:hypothetical protein